MLASRVLSRASRLLCRTSQLLSASEKTHMPILSNQFHSLASQYPTKLIPGQVSLFDHLNLNSSTLQRFGFSSTASPESSEKENGGSLENNGSPSNSESGQAEVSGSNSESETTESQSVKRRRSATKRTAFSDSDSDSESESDLSSDDLVKLVAEKDEVLKVKDKQIEEMKDKVLRAYAEMENVMDRTKREAENSRKFAIQSFAKGLLDVADNLGRASSVVKDSFSKIDVTEDTSGAVPLLKTLLEGVEMTEKQLAEVFRKFGVEKYDPMNEPFDPHRHNALFQIPDNSKPPGTVAVVLKPGYMLHDRIIRPAEVGVTPEAENN